MSNPSQRHAVLLFALFAGACGGDPPPEAPVVTRESEGLGRYNREILPILENYCYDCHGDEMDKGDLALDKFETDSDLLAARQIWDHVQLQVGSHVMPPKNKPQPSIEERRLITSWIDEVVFWCDCENPDPGRVVLRRLNRTEYDNTVRDIFGIEFRPADNFPPDDTGYGFDNIADVLSLSPSLLEKYYAAAVQISEKAIQPPVALLRKQRVAPSEFTVGGDGIREGLAFFSSEGGMHRSFHFPAKGRYRIKFEATGTRGGNELPKLDVRVGGFHRVFDIDAVVPKRKTYEATFTAEKGDHRLSIEFTNDFYDPKNPNPDLRDRNVAVGVVEIEGPLDLPPPAPSRFRQQFLTSPIPKDREARKALAEEIIAKVGRRLYRRPVTAEEVGRLAAFLGMAEENGDSFETGLRLAMEAMLISPHFLYRGGGDPVGNPEGMGVLIDEFSLASRLSYFLWSTAPDDELLDLATAGKLRSELSSQVDRMLKSEKSYALADNFGGQWLQLRNMDLVSPDPKLFPNFDKKLAADMRRETELYLANIFWENRSVLELMDAKYTFANARLAKHYGIRGVEGDHFRRISLDGTGRGGILTQGSILTLTSNPNRTSPVKRGKFVLESILATPPPPAPQDVPEFEEDHKEGVEGTLRDRFEAHRVAPRCAGCHEMMDPLGFAFENFDAVGAWRTEDEGHPIDATGKLVTGESFHNFAGLRAILSRTQPDAFLNSMTEHMLTYALGRGTEPFDKCAIEEIVEKTKAADYHSHAFIKAIVDCVAFQKRRME